MCKYIRAIPLIMFFSLNTISPALAEIQYDLNQMNIFLSSLKGVKKLNFPQVEIKGYPVSEYPEDKTPIPLIIQNMFDAMQTQIFGKQQLIKVEACQFCNFRADFKKKSVMIELAKVEQFYRLRLFTDTSGVLEYILAHEIGHFIHELSTQNSMRKSVNRLPSLQIPRTMDKISRTELMLVMQAHAEVDVYALLILKRIGKKPTNEILDYLDIFSVPGDSGNEMDVMARKLAIKQVMNRLWPDSTL